MAVKFANNAYATLAAGVASSDTSITLTSGQGARFPSLSGSDYFYATLIDTSNNLEIVKVTARATDVLTVSRGQESTTARTFVAGDRIELRVTAAGLEDATNIDNTVPDQTGNSGEYLTTNGSAVSWSALPPSDNASALTTGTLDHARMENGTTLRQWHIVDKTVTTLSTAYNNYVQWPGFTLTVTPLSTNSKFFFILNPHGENEQSTSGMQLYVNGSEITSVNNAQWLSTYHRGFGQFAWDPDNSSTASQDPMTVFYHPNTTSSTVFSFRAGCGYTSGSGTIYVNRSVGTYNYGVSWLHAFEYTDV